MPTYTCTATRGCLDAGAKARIAAAITRVHAAATGAPAAFAQVIFSDVAPGDWFVGGAPLDPADGGQVFVHGRIRAGRSVELRHALITGLTAAISEAAGLPAHGVWVYLHELPARAMVEYGHVLPEPGDEAGWMVGLPGAVRGRMRGAT